MQRDAVTDDADNDAFGDECLGPQIDPYRLELLVLGQQPDELTVLAVTFDGNLVLEARHNDLPAADLRRAMDGNEIAIEDAGIFHTHAFHTQQIVRFGIKKRRIEFVMRLDMFLGEDWTAGCNPAHERQPHLFAQGILELDTTGSARHEFDRAFFLQRPQVLLGGIGRPETEFAGDLGTRWRHPEFGDKFLNHIENL